MQLSRALFDLVPLASVLAAPRGPSPNLLEPLNDHFEARDAQLASSGPGNPLIWRPSEAKTRSEHDDQTIEARNAQEIRELSTSLRDLEHEERDRVVQAVGSDESIRRSVPSLIGSTSTGADDMKLFGRPVPGRRPPSRKRDAEDDEQIIQAFKRSDDAESEQRPADEFETAAWW